MHRPPRDRLLVLVICVVLLSLTWIIYGQTSNYPFVSYDDPVYVSENPNVAHGLSRRAVIWAFTHAHAENWHPLTSLSHMLDAQVFGLNAGAHHLINVFLHTIAAVLLFLMLLEITGSPSRTGNVWRSAFVAVLFALHPLHVESVAWVAERKDVLSGVFFMLTLLAYVRYTRERSAGRYILTAIVFACGLMSKPMLVTTPVVMLLLDYWPLERGQMSDIGRQTSDSAGRFPARTWSQLVSEKLPFFVLSAASSVVTVLVQQTAVSSLETLPLSWRLQNAIVSCVTYLYQFFWPLRLAPFYPHPQDRLALWQVLGSGLLLIFITVAAFILRRKRPYLIVGWLWYLVMLAPVIGVVQVGLQGHADRYTYLPLIGPCIAVTWMFSDFLAARHWPRAIPVGAAIIVIGALVFCARTQAGYWRDNESLWNHALAVTANNDVAHNNLGNVFLKRERFDDAISHFQEALNIRSRKGESQYNLGRALSYNNLGIAFVKKGRIEEGIVYYGQALQTWPNYADAHYNLGDALFQKGQIDDAIAEWQKTLAIQPDDAGAHSSLANALLQKGSLDEAIAHYEAALKVDSGSATTLNNLAWVLSTCPDASVRAGRRAVELAQRAVQLSGGKEAVYLRTLAAAYAETGRFNEAMEAAQRALQMTERESNSEGGRAMQKDIELYRANSPLRDAALAGPQ
jgi:protein O-mannosyl-transferase